MPCYVASGSTPRFPKESVIDEDTYDISSFLQEDSGNMRGMLRSVIIALVVAETAGWVLYTNTGGTRSYNTTKCWRKASEVEAWRGRTCAGTALGVSTEHRTQDCDGRCREVSWAS